MLRQSLSAVVLTVGALASSQGMAAPIYATSLVASNHVTVFGSGDVTGAPDGGGLWLGSTVDPPAQLGTFTVSFSTALGNGAGADLVILDVAPSSNETFNVEVSSDNSTYTLLGEFSATNNQVDFGGFGGPVSYVRLTNTSTVASADIDALYGNYVSTVPEPASVVLFGLGLAGLVGLPLRRRRSKT